jgi:anti-anti-sigma factor
MNSHFRIKTIGSQLDIAHILIPESLDTITAYQLQEKIKYLMSNGTYKCIIDFEDVRYFSSAGIEVLFRLQKELRSKHGGMILANIAEKILRLFDTIGIITMFRITDTVEQAIKEFEPDER